jgi:hypothetical protein
MRLRIRPSGAPSPRKSVASSITAHLALRIPAPARNGTPTEDDGAGSMSMSTATKKYRCGPLPPEAFGGLWHPHPIGMIRDHALPVTVPPDALICSARSVTSWIEFLNAPMISLGPISGCTSFRNAARRYIGPSENVGPPGDGSLLQMPSSSSNLSASQSSLECWIESNSG